MNKSCEIIKDLLPLYLDGVCSNDSKAAVEEHIALCDGCKSELNAMKTTLPIRSVEQNLVGAETVNKLSRRWKRGMKKSLLKGIVIAIIAIAAIALLLFLFFDFQIVYSGAGI